jgi:hypothetical protein
MAAKKKGKGKSAKKRALQTVRLLTRRAQGELAELRAQRKAGTLRGAKLDTGLKKLQKRLEHISMHEFRL